MADTPNVRFKGFQDAWEWRKLSEYLTVSTEKNTENIFDKTDVLSVSGDYGIVNQIEFQGRSFAGASVSNYGVVYTDDVVYTKSPLRSNPYGIIKTNKGNTGIVSTLYAIYRPKENVFANFVQTYFEQHARLNNYMHPLVNKGAKNDMKVSSENALKGSVVFPKYEEQKKISSFFADLDHLITLYQRKCDETKELKKYMLQKMFPRNGKKTPEIRFAGFTDDWEPRKFGDENDLLTGYPFESEKFVEDGIRLVRGMNVKRGYLDFSEEICMKWNSSDGLENYLLKDGDILIQMDGALIGQSYAKIKEDQLPALLVQRVTRVRTKKGIADSDFMYQTIQRDFLAYIGMNKTETAVPHLSLNDIKNFTIMAPAIEEQRKLGTYFANLDNLITLHQCKCDALKEVKKYMLQNMFPQKG